MPRLHDRPVRYLERQPRDDHVAQRAAAHVDALPEAGHAEEDAALIRAEALDQRVPRHARALDVHRVAIIHQRVDDALGHGIERAEAGEQDERAAVGLAHVVQDARGQLVLVLRVRGFGHGAVHDELHQLLVVERAAELHGLRVIAAEADGRVTEVALPRGKRRAREHHALVLGKEVLAEDGPHVHRRAHHGDVRALAAATLLAGLHPVDAAREGLRQEVARARGVRLRTRGVRIELELVGLRRDAVAQHAQRGGQLQHGRAQVVLHRVLAAHAPGTFAVLLVPAPERVELPVRGALAVAHAADGVLDGALHGIVRAHRAQVAAAGAGLVQRAQQVADAALGEPDSEVLRGHVLDLVRLVEDHVVVRRQHAARRARARAHGEIREEQRMVRDEELPVLHAPARRLVEALVERGAAAAHAVVGIALHLVPHLAARQLRQRGQRTVLGVVGPLLHAVQVVAVVVVAEEAALALARELQAPQAHVVAAALHEHRAELLGNHRVEERDVLLDELLLQADGVGGHHHALAALDDPPNGRQEVREALADARARFHEEALPLLEGALHRARHQHLLRADLEARQPPRDGAGV